MNFISFRRLKLFKGPSSRQKNGQDDEPAPKEKRIETTDDYPIEKEKYDPLVDDIEPSFDGDTPEIPVVFIVAAAFILMLIAGLVIFRERVIAFFKSGKGGRPPTPAGV